MKIILIRDKNYPEVLVLEYGADRPNDIKKLCSIARPDIAIVTNIGDIPVHVEFFKDIESVYTEKANIIKMMKKTGSAILNYDNEKIYGFRKYTQGKIISYGFDNDADVHISSYKIETNDELIDSKMYIRFEYKNHFAPFEIQGVLGKGFAYAFMCAISVGVALDINLLDSLHALEDYQLLPGRLNLINGIKNSYIFNDCYNASPLAVKNSLELLNEFKNNRKLFIFGDMKELGNFSEKAHRLVAKYIIDNNIKIFVGIGEKTKFTIESLEKLDFDKNNIYYFNTSEEARLKVQDLIYPGDLILIKGSHSMKMDIISREIAFEPDSIV
ncbi:MAG: UDP-N-acetylmuramoyl-tripeptide--D-alanyl-D-alanine ligase [Candidatus Pacebacteria bacterium]|nr:UDP-N-acetylmuramoyl-tripeptide--D-alanyl-D-alanine ligase [Candidatus Paceibacterota bacterium]